MKKISIIIVCYNGEKYIDNCIKKLSEQKNANYEIIFIDDGSNDKTEQKVMKYNNIVKYFKINHKGIAYARNYGIKKSTGDYFMFVDVDDYIETNSLELLTNNIDENTDLIKYGYKLVSNDGKILDEIMEDNTKTTGEALFKILCEKKRPFEMTCIYLYQKKFWEKNKFKYSESHLHEDFGLTPLVIIKAKNVTVLDKSLYYYVQSDNSITRNKNMKSEKVKAFDYLYHYQNLLIGIEKENINPQIKNMFKSYIANAVIEKARVLDKKTRKEYINELKEKHVFNNLESKSIAQKLKKIIIKMCPNIYYIIR